MYRCRTTTGDMTVLASPTNVEVVIQTSENTSRSRHSVVVTATGYYGITSHPYSGSTWKSNDQHKSSGVYPMIAVDGALVMFVLTSLVFCIWRRLRGVQKIDRKKRRVEN